MVFFLITSILFSSTGPGTFELGIILGEPTGISAKLWFSQNTALDGAVSWSLRDNDDDNLYLHADYLWHDFGLINTSSGRLPLYYGIGGRVVLANNEKFGARVPVGLSWLFKGAPLDLFLEIAAIVDFIPDMDVDFNGGIGLRFIF